MATIAVVGAGIAGLSAAWQLATRHPRHRVVVLEGSPRIGGRLQPARLAGQQLDVGAEAMLVRRPEGVQLAGELGLALVHPAGVPAAIWSRGVRHPMPKGTVMGVPSDPSALAGLLTHDEVRRAEQERPVRVADGQDISIGALVERALGPAVVDRLVEPLLGGVYAGHARQLSTRSSVPVLYQAALRGDSLIAVARRAASRAAGATPGPVFGTLVDGLAGLPRALVDRLGEHGVPVRTETMVRQLCRAGSGWRLTTGPTRDEAHLEADAVVLALPARPAARLLAPTAPDAAAAIGQIDYASMVIVAYAFDAERAPQLRGSSGFLVPPVDGRTIKAATFTSSKWPWLAEARPDLAFVRVSMGRFGETATLQAGAGDLARAGLADLRAAVGDLPDPVGHVIQRWGGGLPQYLVGHADRVDAGRAALPAGLALAGAAYDGVGVPACIGSGRAAADRVATLLSGG